MCLTGRGSKRSLQRPRLSFGCGNWAFHWRQFIHSAAWLHGTLAALRQGLRYRRVVGRQVSQLMEDCPLANYCVHQVWITWQSHIQVHSYLVIASRKTYMLNYVGFLMEFFSQIVSLQNYRINWSLLVQLHHSSLSKEVGPCSNRHEPTPNDVTYCQKLPTDQAGGWAAAIALSWWCCHWMAEDIRLVNAPNNNNNNNNYITTLAA